MASKEFYRAAAEMRGKKAEESPKKEKKTEEEVEKEGGINQAAIKGEPLTGFEKRIVDGVDKGPFECGNCHYFVGPVGVKGPKRGEKGCNQSDMREKSEEPKLSDGRIEVKPKDCCEFVERLGKSEKDEKKL